MSGHSKWATIRRAKATTDQKKGAIFTKLANLITIAAREKGGDLETNFTLRMAVDKAKAVNMPKDNIERAIKRGTGELEGGQIDELVYEGIAPGNSQVVVISLTDNRNRSASTVRHAFTKYGGSLGSVMWNFDRKGVIRVTADELKDKKIEWDELELELIDQGMEDIEKEDEGVTIYTALDNLAQVKKFLEEKVITTESAELEYIAKEEVSLNDEDRERYDKLIEELEECEDVSSYFSNVAD